MPSKEQSLIKAAFAAADEAMKAKVGKCTPMMVVQPRNPFDNSGSLVTAKAAWHVPAGPCGFAWVKIRPARGKLVTELKKRNIGRADSYAGGYHVSMRCNIRGYEQSMETLEAGANAFAKVLTEAGINAYSDSRMD